MERFARALIEVQASSISAADRSRAENLAMLFAWCGEGELTPNQVHAFLRPDASVPRPRATGLLLRADDGTGYVATACHVLSEPGESARQAVLGSDRPDAAGPLTAASPEVAEPTHSLTAITLDPAVSGARDGKIWFPATSFPHLDLALIRLGEAGSAACVALERAGFAFLSFDHVGTSPSREGAEVAVLCASPRGSGPSAPPVPPIAVRVSSLIDALSFFWLDRPVPAGCEAAPVVERDSIVGILSPQIDARASADTSGEFSPSYATVAKARFLRELLDAARSRAP